MLTACGSLVGVYFRENTHYMCRSVLPRPIKSRILSTCAHITHHTTCTRQCLRGVWG